MKAGDKNKAELFIILRTLFGSAEVETEFRFHPTRRFRFDYAVPSLKLAVEYDGVNYAPGKHLGGHSSLIGLTNNNEKFNQAALLGWTVLRFTKKHFDGKLGNLTSPFDTLEAIKKNLTKDR